PNMFDNAYFENGTLTNWDIDNNKFDYSLNGTGVNNDPYYLKIRTKASQVDEQQINKNITGVSRHNPKDNKYTLNVSLGTDDMQRDSARAIYIYFGVVYDTKGEKWYNFVDEEWENYTLGFPFNPHTNPAIRERINH